MPASYCHSACRIPRAQFAACHRVAAAAGFGDLELTTIRFDAGGAAFSALDQARLDLVAKQILADRMTAGVIIDGHADRQGSHRANLHMSRMRAERVARYLSGRGVPRGLLTVRYHGAEFLLDPADHPAADQRNRRVTVQLRRAGQGASVEVAHR